MPGPDGRQHVKLHDLEAAAEPVRPRSAPRSAVTADRPRRATTDRRARLAVADPDETVAVERRHGAQARAAQVAAGVCGAFDLGPGGVCLVYVEERAPVDPHHVGQAGVHLRRAPALQRTPRSRSAEESTITAPYRERVPAVHLSGASITAKRAKSCSAYQRRSCPLDHRRCGDWVGEGRRALLVVPHRKGGLQPDGRLADAAGESQTRRMQRGRATGGIDRQKATASRGHSRARVRTATGRRVGRETRCGAGRTGLFPTRSRETPAAGVRAASARDCGHPTRHQVAASNARRRPQCPRWPAAPSAPDRRRSG